MDLDQTQELDNDKNFRAPSLETISEGLDNTVKSYWDDPYKTKQKARILRVLQTGSKTHVVLDQTLFVPDDGAQSGDSGWIRSKTGELEVKETSWRKGVIVHNGKSSGSLEPNTDVEIEVYWPSRLQHMRLLTLGYLISAAIWKIKPEARIIESKMHKPGWISMDTPLNADEIKKIEGLCKKTINDNKQVKITYMDYEELVGKIPQLPKKIPKGKLRMFLIEGFSPIPCGGTILRTLKEIKQWKIIGMRGDKLLFDLQ